MSAASMPCLDENILSGYLRRALPEEEQARAEDHLRGCAQCRELIGGMAEVFAGSSQRLGGTSALDANGSQAPLADAPLAFLAGGTSVGRYVILRPIGAGGFGVVYAAYDPKLDRKIALKVVRADRLGLEPGAQNRLLREAQAMARLVHPNVTAVYDVAASGEQISIAMEFVEGTNARDWLAEGSRTWREILDFFIQAGRGLEAAHAAGLVHRDFKPANVLIGRDGRASVADFGMARHDVRGDGRAPVTDFGMAWRDGARTVAAEATHTKGVIGTPAYMSPEQHQGRPATAQSDQFSFCVALYESLFGQHPFVAETPTDLPSAVIEGKRRPLASRGEVPRWLIYALERGLEREPSRRFGSMSELLAAISLEPRRRRQRQLMVVGAACLLSAIPLARIYDLRRQRASLCTGASAHVAKVWGPAQKEKTRAAFLANGGRFGPDAWARTERALDSYLDAWAAMFTDACQATRLRGEQSDEVLTARMLCLDQLLTESRHNPERARELATLARDHWRAVRPPR